MKVDRIQMVISRILGCLTYILVAHEIIMAIGISEIMRNPSFQSFSRYLGE